MVTRSTASWIISSKTGDCGTFLVPECKQQAASSRHTEGYALRDCHIAINRHQPTRRFGGADIYRCRILHKAVAIEHKLTKFFEASFETRATRPAIHPVATPNEAWAGCSESPGKEGGAVGEVIMTACCLCRSVAIYYKDDDIIMINYLSHHVATWQLYICPTTT